MKPFFQIVLYFLISLGQARDLIFHDEGDPDSYPVIETLNASEKMNKLQVDDDMKASDVENRSGIEKERDAVKLSGFPYVGEDCCNLSTTPACLKIKGSCVPRNETCNGDVYYGNEYCVISNLKSCMCCVPLDTTTTSTTTPKTTTTTTDTTTASTTPPKTTTTTTETTTSTTTTPITTTPSCCKTLSPCEKLNGTCIGTHESCDGNSVTGKEFCNKDKTCKCCFPCECQTPKPTECPQPTTAKPKPQECQKLGGRCMSKRNEKKCKGKIDKMGTCKLKNYGCCIPNTATTTKTTITLPTTRDISTDTIISTAIDTTTDTIIPTTPDTSTCSLEITASDGVSDIWESPNYDGNNKNYPEGDYCCWLNITIPSTYDMFHVTMTMGSPANIHVTSQCIGDRITYFSSVNVQQTLCGDLSSQSWTEIAVFNTPLSFGFEWCSVKDDGGTDLGFQMNITGKDLDPSGRK